MRKRPDGKMQWSLERHNLQENLWDHICPGCQQAPPTFVHSYIIDTPDRLTFGYLCEKCAQKRLAEWLRCTDRTDYRLFEHITDFDAASVYLNQQNNEEVLMITRWSYEQRQKRLQDEK
jgi:protein-arginine kinase activator protein McsA